QSRFAGPQRRVDSARPLVRRRGAGMVHSSRAGIGSAGKSARATAPGPPSFGNGPAARAPGGGNHAGGLRDAVGWPRAHAGGCKKGGKETIKMSENQSVRKLMLVLTT